MGTRVEEKNKRLGTQAFELQQEDQRREDSVCVCLAVSLVSDVWFVISICTEIDSVICIHVHIHKQ